MFSSCGSELSPSSQRNTASNDHLISNLLRHEGAEQLKCHARLGTAIGRAKRTLSMNKSGANRAADSRRPKLQNI
jgi:hypothetical protein